MARMINSAGLALVKEYEGIRLEAYPDTGGVWTICWGHTKGVEEGDTASMEQCETYLEVDLMSAEQLVSRLVKVPLNDNQFSALVSFAFNEGAFPKSTLLKKLNARDYEAVPAELAKWIYDNGKIEPGLVKRRAAESALWTA